VLVFVLFSALAFGAHLFNHRELVRGPTQRLHSLWLSNGLYGGWRIARVLFMCQERDDQFAFDEGFNNSSRDMLMALAIEYQGPVSRGDVSFKSYCDSLRSVALAAGRVVGWFAHHRVLRSDRSSTSVCEAFATFAGTPSARLARYRGSGI
jgi:hypothetical protein